MTTSPFNLLKKFGTRGGIRTHMRFPSTDFLTTIVFTTNLLIVCGLDFLLAILIILIINLGCQCKVSTLGYLHILARDYHFKGFPVLAGCTYCFSTIRLKFKSPLCLPFHHSSKNKKSLRALVYIHILLFKN